MYLWTRVSLVLAGKLRSLQMPFWTGVRPERAGKVSSLLDVLVRTSEL